MKKNTLSYLIAALSGALIMQTAYGFNPRWGTTDSTGSTGNTDTSTPVQTPDTGSDSGSGTGSTRPPAVEEYEPVTNQYVYKGISPSNAQHTDSAHFRIYHNGSGVANISQGNLDVTLAHLEAAYNQFVVDGGFRSPGLSVHSDRGPAYKLNVYPQAYMNAGGVMLYDYRAGLSYLEVLSSQLTIPRVTVHEYGHSLALASKTWVDQGRTGAWWETVANWVADTYLNSPYYEDVQKRYGLAAPSTIIDLNKVIGQSNMMIVSDQNYYEAWPFLTYLTSNPDKFPGLGKNAVRDMLKSHSGNNETPLHVLERVASSTKVQRILGRYWAHMAYMDIGHPRAQQLFFNSRSRLNFANLDSIGNQTYRVKSNRQPQYGGANINPLTVNGNGTVSVDVTNLGNGLRESNFTATLAIRARNGSVRYVDLPNGSGQAVVNSDEEVSLVVANTPDTLYQYDAFRSTSSSPEMKGLNYQVKLTGATPAR